MTKAIAPSLLLAFLVACGGATPPAVDADDAAVPDADEVTTDAADSVADEAPSNNGIIRDMDGDGKPDEAGGACSEKNETQCKISAGCAWSDDGSCVDAP